MALIELADEEGDLSLLPEAQEELKKLKEDLEAEEVQVVMSREEDAGLYQESSSNKKLEDMKNRVLLIHEAQPDCAVSIHQNSYTEASVSGAQVGSE